MTANRDMTTPLSAAHVIQNALADLTPNLFTTIVRDLSCGDAREMLAEAHGKPITDPLVQSARWAVIAVGGNDAGQLSITLTAHPTTRFPNDQTQHRGVLVIHHLSRVVVSNFTPIAAGPLHQSITRTLLDLGLTLDGQRMGGQR